MLQYPFGARRRLAIARRLFCLKHDNKYTNCQDRQHYKLQSCVIVTKQNFKNDSARSWNVMTYDHISWEAEIHSRYKQLQRRKDHRSNPIQFCKSHTTAKTSRFLVFVDMYNFWISDEIVELKYQNHTSSDSDNFLTRRSFGLPRQPRIIRNFQSLHFWYSQLSYPSFFMNANRFWNHISKFSFFNIFRKSLNFSESFRILKMKIEARNLKKWRDLNQLNILHKQFFSQLFLGAKL